MPRPGRSARRGAGASGFLPRLLVLLTLLISTTAHAGDELDLAPERAASMRQAVLESYRAPPRFSPGPSSTLMPHFIYARDAGLELPLPPWQTDAAYAEAFEIARRAWAETQPDHVRALMVFTSFDDGGRNLFYVPLANDVQGLGDTQAVRIFDDTPDSVLDGYIWMGSVERLIEAGDAYFREAFIHEIAHRWGSYVAVAHPDLATGELRGRQSSHWSFFVDSHGSPMEGNHWVPDDQGMITQLTRPPRFRFSPLDLYLMGVLPPEQVPPFQVIIDFSSVSPSWVMPAPDTPPAHRTGEPVALLGAQSVDVTIDDVIAASGRRYPPALDQSIVWPVGAVYLSNNFDRPSLDDFATLERRLVELAADFENASGGRVTVDLSVRGAGTLPRGAACPQLDACDRSQSDACISLVPGEPPICTRTCETADVCHASECCAGGFCAPLAVCRDTLNAGTDGGVTGSVKPPGPGLGLEGAEPSCGCTTTSRTTAAWTVVLLFGAALFRAAGSRR